MSTVRFCADSCLSAVVLASVSRLSVGLGVLFVGAGFRLLVVCGRVGLGVLFVGAGFRLLVVCGRAGFCLLDVCGYRLLSLGCLWVLVSVSCLSVVVVVSVCWLSVGAGFRLLFVCGRTGFCLLVVCGYWLLSLGCLLVQPRDRRLSVGTGFNALFAVVLALVSCSLVLASVSCLSVGTGFSLLVACGYCHLSHFCHWLSTSVL